MGSNPPNAARREKHVLRFTYADGSESFTALHRVQTMYYNENKVLTVRVDRADGYWEEFTISAFEMLAPGRVYG